MSSDEPSRGVPRLRALLRGANIDGGRGLVATEAEVITFGNARGDDALASILAFMSIASSKLHIFWFLLSSKSAPFLHVSSDF